MRELECLLQMYMTVNLGAKKIGTNELRFPRFIYSSKIKHNQNYCKLRRPVSHRVSSPTSKGLF